MSGDSYTEVTSQSWFSRLGNAFKGIVAGIILIAIAFFLLFWNEGRAVKRYQTLKEGGGVVVSVSADTVDAANQGKLVHLTGKAETGEILEDSVFGISASAIKLKRNAEMYQWQQESKSEERKKLGGGTETVTTYSYNKVWSPDLISSGSFKESEGHQNPGQMPFQSEEQVAGHVTVGAFTLSPSLVGKINAYTPVTLSSEYVLPESLKDKAQLSSTTVYVGQDPANPRIGDVRVSFQEVRPMDISLVSSQVNDTFEPYHAKTGGSIELLQIGTHSAEGMFQQAQKSNTIMTWVLRVVGLALMFTGFRMVLAPLSVFADVVPIVGTIVGAGTGFIALLIAGVLSFLTIAIAWFVYRPVLSIILLAIAGALGAGIFVKLRKAPAVATPPPPPPGAGS
ncbi:MAG: TMEM43 family protein [Desulfobulbaceae bacterium]|nr:TMEM43 family protein [Desulfobulbaceae bacterium]